MERAHDNAVTIFEGEAEYFGVASAEEVENMGIDTY